MRKMLYRDEAMRELFGKFWRTWQKGFTGDRAASPNSRGFAQLAHRARRF
jgi:hypothetical protein